MKPSSARPLAGDSGQLGYRRRPNSRTAEPPNRGQSAEVVGAAPHPPPLAVASG